MELFPENEEQSSSCIDLEEESSVWDTFIINKIRKVTENLDVSISIFWSKKDDKKGVAIGSAIIVNNKNKLKINVPILVQDFKMAPLDVALTESGNMLFTKENIENFFFDGSLGVGTKKGDKTGFGSYTRIYNTNNDMPEIDKISSVVSSREDYVINNEPVLSYNLQADQQDLEKVSQKIKENITMFDGLDILLDNINSVNKGDDINLHYIKKEGPDKYTIYGGSYEQFEPIIKSMDSIELKEKLEGDNILSIPQQIDNVLDTLNVSQEYYVEDVRKADKNYDEDDDIVVVHKGDLKPKDIETGFFYLKNKEEDSYESCMCIKHVCDLKKNIKESFSLCVDKDNKGGEISRSSKGFVSKKPFSPFEEITSTDNGKGYFVYFTENSNQNNALAVGPVTIKGVVRSEYRHDEIRYLIADYKGKDIKLHLVDYIKDIINVSNEHNKSATDTYEIPSYFNWLPIKEKKIYSSISKDKTPADVTTIKKESSVSYSIKNRSLKTELIDKDQLNYYLSRGGASFQKAAYLKKLVDYSGKVDVFGLKGLLDKELYKQSSVEEKFKEEDIKPFKGINYLDILYNLEDGINKYASDIEKLNTIDALLSLNFINPLNVRRFLNALPKLESLIQTLIRLLIVARIGAPELKEDSIKQAIESIEETIRGLKMLGIQAENE